MKVSRGSLATVLCFLMVSLFFSSGCAYLKNRGNDALDVFDVGVTASKEPKFAIYAGFLNVTALGYSNLDGTLVGIGGREVGVMPVRQHAEGSIFHGSEQLGYADFNMEDPDSPEMWRVGIIGLLEGPPPPKGQIVNCPKLLHFGWIGFTLNCRFGELADLILGLTTLDIMGDDSAGAAASGEPTA